MYRLPLASRARNPRTCFLQSRSSKLIPPGLLFYPANIASSWVIPSFGHCLWFLYVITCIIIHHASRKNLRFSYNAIGSHYPPQRGAGPKPPSTYPRHAASEVTPVILFAMAGKDETIARISEAWPRYH